MNNEQEEAKSHNVFSLFINSMMDTMKSIQLSTENKTGQDRADAIHACLLDCLDAANLIGKDNPVLFEGTPFTNTQAQTIITQAILFAGSKYGPIQSAQMEHLLNSANTCIEELKKEYHKQGIHHQISPDFHVILSGDGKTLLGLIDKNKPTNDDDTATSPIN